MSTDASGQRGAEYGGPVPPPLPNAGEETVMVPAAPPTRPGMLGVPPRAAAWHVPIGIAAIVMASAGVLRSTYSAASPWMFGHLGVFVPGSNAGFDPFAGVRLWGVWITAVHGALLVVAVAMIVGAIGVLQRRRWGMWMMIASAAVRILLAVVEAFVAAGVQQAQMEAMSNQPGGPLLAAFGNGLAWFGAVTSIGWYSVFPAFVLIWFICEPVRREVRTWRSSRG